MAHITNTLATVDQLYRRNTLDALPQDLQDTIFYATQCLTQAAGILLRLPQSATAQANVVLARYWLVDSALANEFSDVSAATLFLTAKLGSHPCQPRDICNVYTYLLSPSSPLFQFPSTDPPPNDPSAYYLSEGAYTAFHNRILRLEARIVYSLSFDTHVALPHPLAITYLQALDFLSQPKAKVSQRVVEYLNTALLSPQLLYLTHQPNALAVAAIYSAARDVGAKMPDCAWWEVFDVDREELGFLVVGMRSLEGWVRKQRDEVEGLLGQGMVTRKGVEAEMRKRGLGVGNGGNGAPGPEEEDEEAAMMRKLDERVAMVED
ncbi:cyclin-like protein [Pseudomassariella vexata]|uniref:Cyclin-like protein n=1 Tax=Pseudomassariella vexata TaxID=1141098 RepID=A0A1Y2E0Z7_9PEZI|nr:cyclin-like protein [Pseudomassariella vexata]ORY65212.1 cyclin-like protein [Pseudomassariella vexata]